ncbi:hypothetical protein AK812_SmicGene8607 [Symbiodinium microadriaticum]|uniref:Uncharacterized protein n=1 Tax=Symbiodinium microadriaticum TaxID=2951 RepID=A0A1Q9EKM3_SYMMI|nr:hypothetical protein AK812_SmicGene8607 [Symbiodinium microadriaticum]
MGVIFEVHTRVLQDPVRIERWVFPKGGTNSDENACKAVGKRSLLEIAGRKPSPQKMHRLLGQRSIAQVTKLGDERKLGQATVRDFREDLLLDTLEVLQRKDPADLGPEDVAAPPLPIRALANSESEMPARPSLRLPHHFLQAVRGALRQGLHEEAADVIRQLVRREGVDGNESLLRVATQEATLQDPRLYSLIAERP